MFKEARDVEGNWLIKVFTFRFLTQNGGGFKEGNLLMYSYGNSLGFTKSFFDLDLSGPESEADKETMLEKAICSTLFYLFTVRDSFVMVETLDEKSEGNFPSFLNFLNIDINGIHLADYVRESDYSRLYKPIPIWSEGKIPSLTPEKYEEHADDFGEIIADLVPGLYIAYHNMGPNSNDIETNKKMLWYMWQKQFKPLFWREFELDEIEDLTDIGLNDKDRF